MSPCTPDWTAERDLPPLASRYVDDAALPWRATAFPGVHIKILLEDKASGLLTTLTRMEPGAVLPRHEHTAVEQSYVIEGRLVDDEGAVSAGQYVWRPAGSVHTAVAPEGALILGIFLSPNHFL